MSTGAGLILIVALFVSGALLAARAGIRSIQSARKVSFFRMRRAHMIAGWKWLLLALFLFSFSVASALVGEPIANQFFPPTLRPTASPTQTPFPTATLPPSATRTNIPTVTATPEFTLTPTPTQTFTATSTPSPTSTRTATVTSTSTLTPTQTPSRTVTATSNSTLTATVTASPPPTATLSRTPSRTPSATQNTNATSTAAARTTQTARAIAVLSYTPTSTQILTATPSRTPTFVPSSTSTVTPSLTPTSTLTNTPAPTVTAEPTRTPLPSPTSTFTPTQTMTPTASFTPTLTFTPSLSPTFTPTPRPTLTSSPTWTPSPTFTPTSIPTSTLTPVPSATLTATRTPTASATPSTTGTMSRTPTGTLTPSHTPAFTFTPSRTPTRTPTRTATPTITRTPTPNRGCDRIEFIADVTVPRNSVFAPDASFTKVWRLKNVGTCTWKTTYRLVLVSGDRMGGQNLMPLPSEVSPGQTIDLKMDFTAPKIEGTYQSNWQIRNDKGEIFGTTAAANRPFSLFIRVKMPPPTGTVYDFAANVCSAQWSSGAGTLNCEGANFHRNGFVLRQSVAKPENGASVLKPSLLTVPQNTLYGHIRALYPSFHVQKDDHFQAVVGCEVGATSCGVLFRLDYQLADGVVHELWAAEEHYEGNMSTVDIDLSSLAGQDVNFVLTVLSLGPASDNRALWIEPRFTRMGSAALVTLTPTP